MNSDAVGGGRLVALSPMRAAIARRMIASKREAPHFYVESEVDMERVLAFVEQARGAATRLTVTAVLARACAVALRRHPKLNAFWREDGYEEQAAINLGVGIALEDGLVAPALLDAGSMLIADTAAALADLAERARSGRLRAPEMSEATFTLSNLGMFGVTRFAAIIVPPQVAILATGKIAERVVLNDGCAVGRRFMSATVSADHRVVDGAQVAAFLETLGAVLQDPEHLDD